MEQRLSSRSMARWSAWAVPVAVAWIVLPAASPALADQAATPNGRVSSAATPVPTVTRVPAPVPTVTPVPTGIPAVGPVFPAGIGSPHECTGAVARSDQANLVLTAAHCLTGTGAGVAFVPGYHDGLAPFGVWTVDGVYVDPRWVAGQDPRFDYAVVTVVPARDGRRRPGRLSDLVGGYAVGVAPVPGRRVEVPAYAAGSNDVPFTCPAPTYSLNGYPAFDCHGYVSGTSGSPWLTRDRDGVPVIRGVIGGLHQGGCVEYTSYSSRFTPAVQALLVRATRGGPADELPLPGGDGCDTLTPAADTAAPALAP